MNFCLSGSRWSLRGLSFIPTPQRYDQGEPAADIHAFNWRLNLLDYFNGLHNNKQLPLINKSHWEPPLNSISTTIQNFIE